MQIQDKKYKKVLKYVSEQKRISVNQLQYQKQLQKFSYSFKKQLNHYSPLPFKFQKQALDPFVNHALNTPSISIKRSQPMYCQNNLQQVKQCTLKLFNNKHRIEKLSSIPSLHLQFPNLQNNQYCIEIYTNCGQLNTLEESKPQKALNRQPVIEESSPSSFQAQIAKVPSLTKSKISSQITRVQNDQFKEQILSQNTLKMKIVKVNQNQISIGNHDILPATKFKKQTNSNTKNHNHIIRNTNKVNTFIRILLDINIQLIQQIQQNQADKTDFGPFLFAYFYVLIQVRAADSENGFVIKKIEQISKRIQQKKILCQILQQDYYQVMMLYAKIKRIQPSEVVQSFKKFLSVYKVRLENVCPYYYSYFELIPQKYEYFRDQKITYQGITKYKQKIKQIQYLVKIHDY